MKKKKATYKENYLLRLESEMKRRMEERARETHQSMASLVKHYLRVGLARDKEKGNNPKPI